MNVVLVGGVGDGTRVILKDGTMRYELIKYGPVNLDVNMVTKPIIYEKQVYNLFRLHPVTRAYIFAYEKMTPTDILEALLDGYHP